MTLLADFNPNVKETILAKGDPGTGKTIGMSHWPKPMKIISCDGRIKPVYEWWRERDSSQLKEIDFDVYTAQDFTRLAKVVEGLQMKCPFKSVLLDPLGMVGNMAIEYSIGLRPASSNSAKSLNIGPLIKLRSIEDYGAEERALQQIVDIGRIIPAHFILIAHVLRLEFYELGSEKPRIQHRLLTAGKNIAASLPAFFDEVWRFSVRNSADIDRGKPEFLVHTRGTGEDYAKTAMSYLPNQIVWTDKDLYKVTHPTPAT